MTDIKKQKFVEQIEGRYGENAPDKVEELKKLDDKVQTPPKALAYVLGIFGTLVLGVGMCICLDVITSGLMAVGVVVGVVGIALIVANYFIFKAFLSKRKKKYGEQILKLVNELKSDELAE